MCLFVSFLFVLFITGWILLTILVVQSWLLINWLLIKKKCVAAILWVWVR